LPQRGKNTPPYEKVQETVAGDCLSKGIAKMRVFDHLAAHDLLQRAVDAVPLNAMAHSALADSWWALGYDSRATGEAKKAFESKSPPYLRPNVRSWSDSPMVLYVPFSCS
jgi:Tfp pilus assembly protein PilF